MFFIGKSGVIEYDGVAILYTLDFCLYRKAVRCTIAGPAAAL